MTTYPPCLTCNSPMRPAHNALAKDHPGTVRSGGHGYCLTCRTKQKRAEPIPLAIEPRFFDPQFSRTALDYWIADRNRRLGVSA